MTGRPIGPSTGGVETDRFRAHIAGMSEPQYEIFEATDGTFAVEIRGGDGSDATITKFDSKQVLWIGSRNSFESSASTSAGRKPPMNNPPRGADTSPRHYLLNLYRRPSTYS
jgi:hypothetical protein